MGPMPSALCPMPVSHHISQLTSRMEIVATWQFTLHMIIIKKFTYFQICML